MPALPGPSQLSSSESPKISAETKIASSLILLAVSIQLLTGISNVIQSSDGRGGRSLYYLAFSFTVVQDLFVGIVVPLTLAWVGVDLLRSRVEIEVLTTAAIGAIWFGPDRVQAAFANIVSLRRRWIILVAALSPYHRSCRYAVPPDNPVNANNLLNFQSAYEHSYDIKYVRRLRFAPWWTAKERVRFWNGRSMGVDDSQKPLLSDGQLRSIARHGIKMALSGGFEEHDLRVWCAWIVVDQARYPLSPLGSTPRHEFGAGVFSGYEGSSFMEVITKQGSHWYGEGNRQNECLDKLATVMDGIRKQGLSYLRKNEWVH